MTELKWTCASCHQPIAQTAKGFVTIRVKDAMQAEEAMQRWEAAHSTSIGVVFQGGELPPRRATWGAYHDDCVPEETPSDYWFALDRCRTTDDLLMWTLHLMEKSWLASTDWDEFAALAARGSGVVEP